MRNIRPAADSFRRMVTNLVDRFHNSETGQWSSFLAGSAPVDVNTTGSVMYLYLDDDTDACPAYLDAVAIAANKDDVEPEEWDVLGDRMLDGYRVPLASFKSLEAALGYALERVCLRNWHAGAQDAHDPVSV